MVTRKDSLGVARGENQRISVDEAIKVWTLDGAYATFEDNIKGSITPGKLADFVVLEKDPRKVPPDTIKDLVLQATYLGGERVYTAPGKAVRMVPQPPLNYGDGNYGDGDEEENQSLSRMESPGRRNFLKPCPCLSDHPPLDDRRIFSTATNSFDLGPGVTGCGSHSGYGRGILLVVQNPHGIDLRCPAQRNEACQENR